MRESDRLAKEFVDKIVEQNKRARKALSLDDLYLIYRAGFFQARGLAADYLMNEGADFYASMVRNVGEHLV